MVWERNSKEVDREGDKEVDRASDLPTNRQVVAHKPLARKKQRSAR